MDQADTVGLLAGIKFHVGFLCFGMHGIFMCVFGSLVSLAWVLTCVIVVFNLAFPFPNSHGVMGFFHLVELYYGMVSELSGVVSGKFPKA